MLGPLGLLLYLASRFALLRDRIATGLAEDAIVTR
jgi:hypothetical protein